MKQSIPVFDTDLAHERLRANTEYPGVTYEETCIDGISVTRLHIKNAEGADAIERPMGHYMTLSFKPLFEDALLSSAHKVISSLLAPFIPRQKNAPLLLVGIGNASLLADSVGPRTAEEVYATAHTKLCGVAVLIPGTEESSGISVPHLVSATVKLLHPSAVIAVDALTTRSQNRLLSTIQITDTGITPGSGVRAERGVLNAAHIGCPVIAIGIPTVISSHAIAAEQNSPNTPSHQIPPLYMTPHNALIGIQRGASLIASAVNDLPVLF